MKPATWYISMLIVAFLYIYLTAIQYIRGAEIRSQGPRNIGPFGNHQLPQQPPFDGKSFDFRRNTAQAQHF